MNFSFPPLKLSNKGMKEYSKLILFIHLFSIPFHSLLLNELKEILPFILACVRKLFPFFFPYTVSLTYWALGKLVIFPLF